MRYQQNKNHPLISIIIPTRNSEKVIPFCFKGIKQQNYPKDKIEVIVVDNESSDNTIAYCKKNGAITLTVRGVPPLVCQQRNLGAKKAKADYLLFLDHDMELSPNLLLNFANKIEELNQDSNIKAWFIPERIVTSSNLLTKIRNFEREFYNCTVVDAVRIIDKKTFFKTGQYDPSLSGGPADWDLDIQLKDVGCEFGTISEPLFHHEERLGGLTNYIKKKSDWTGGLEIYKLKWKKLHKGKYNHIINKQLGLSYRAFTVFFENGKWKKTIRNPHLFLSVILIKSMMLFLSKLKAK